MTSALKIILIFVCSYALALPFEAELRGIAPLVVPPTTQDQLVDDSYVVVLKDETPFDIFNAHMNFVEYAVAASSLRGSAMKIKHTWNSRIIKGYAGHFSRDVIEVIRRNPEVELIEQEQIVRIADSQPEAPWGLARISHRAKLDAASNLEFEYAGEGGEGVMIYVIDTGVYLEHNEFEGRARWGMTVPGAGSKDVDDNGHGTHVAGTVASRKYGVAKRANITAVKVFDASGKAPTGQILAGLVWADKDAARLAEEIADEKRTTDRARYKASIINMSLETSKSESLVRAVKGAVGNGHHVVVAAGNAASNACDFSPANALDAITVGSTNIYDRRLYTSNWGKCVDIFAPGHSILSAGIKGPDSYRTDTGTSMAAPHVSGVLAYLISIYPHATFDPPASKIRPVALAHSVLLDAYTIAYNAVPGYISCMLPSPDKFAKVEEIPVALDETPDVLTPAKLKEAVLKLATKDVLSDTMAANLLLFNNATDPDGKSWVDKFWSFPEMT